MTYDPNYIYNDQEDVEMEEDDAGWGSDFSNDNEANEDDDDTSWKVRRAAIKTIEAIITSRPDMLKVVYQDYADLIVKQFRERDNNVNINILETFSVLLKSTVISELSQSIELELTHQPSLVRQRSSTD